MRESEEYKYEHEDDISVISGVGGLFGETRKLDTEQRDKCLANKKGDHMRRLVDGRRVLLPVSNARFDQPSEIERFLT